MSLASYLPMQATRSLHSSLDKSSDEMRKVASRKSGGSPMRNSPTTVKGKNYVNSARLEQLQGPEEIAYTALVEMQPGQFQSSQKGLSFDIAKLKAAGPAVLKRSLSEMSWAEDSKARDCSVCVSAKNRCRFGCMRRMIIVPERGESSVHYMEMWDLCITLLLMFTCFYVPAEAALPAAELKTVDLVLDILFLFDFGLQFFVAYPVAHENNVTSESIGFWETDPWKIAYRYLTSWCVVDAVSASPALIETKTYSQVMGLAAFRLIRVFRMLRLLRLVRLLDRWHAGSGIPYFWTELFKGLFLIVISCHWFACCWIMVEGKVMKGDITYNTLGESWLSVLIDTKSDPCEPQASMNGFCAYVLALYWSSMTLTTVGYGDIVPQNMVEYSVCICMMLISGLVWAYIVGTIVSILSTSDPYSVIFKQSMDDLNDMMDKRKLPQHLKMRLRLYLHNGRHVMRMRGQRDLLERTISEGLQREVAGWSLQGDVLSAIYWTKDLENDALLEIVRALSPSFYGPSENITLADTMIIIRSGVVAVKGRCLGRGDAYGHESILLETKSLIEVMLPRTLTYTDILGLKREQLIEICRAYPKADARLRRAQIRTAVMRAFVMVARAKRAKGRSDSRSFQMGSTFSQGGTNSGSMRASLRKWAEFYKTPTASNADAHDDFYKDESVYSALQTPRSLSPARGAFSSMRSRTARSGFVEFSGNSWEEFKEDVRQEVMEELMGAVASQQATASTKKNKDLSTIGEEPPLRSRMRPRFLDLPVSDQDSIRFLEL